MKETSVAARAFSRVFPHQRRWFTYQSCEWHRAEVFNHFDPSKLQQLFSVQVVRDLHKKEDSLEQQSYSERQIYLTALNRLSNEYAAVQNLEKKAAKSKLEDLLNQ